MTDNELKEKLQELETCIRSKPYEANYFDYPDPIDQCTGFDVKRSGFTLFALYLYNDGAIAIREYFPIETIQKAPFEIVETYRQLKKIEKERMENY